MRKAFRIPVLAILAVGAFLSIGSSASAQVVVGQLAPGVSPPAECNFTSSYDEIQVAVAAGASYVVPAPGGVLTSWSTNAAAGVGQSLGMKVFRPTGPGTYLVVAHDGPRPLSPGVLNTFPISIPVQAGDVIGISVPGSLAGGAPTACAFETLNLGDIIGYKSTFTADGGLYSPETEFKESRLNVSATVLPPPAIATLGNAHGSIKGGTSVVLTGANFASVLGVTFGTTPAKSFVVNSEGQITAISPASKKLAKVPLTVTTVSGAIASAQTFSYEGCKVPKLKSKKLKAAKKGLRKADCKVGKVKKTGDATSKTGKVTKQNPQPGKILAPGTKVNVTLG